MAETSESKSGKGCLFWGCLTIFVVALLASVLVGVVAFYVYRQASQPVEIPQHEFAEADYERVQTQLRGFGAVEKTPADVENKPLELSQDDLNTLLLGAVPKLQGKAYLRVEDGAVALDASLPSTLIENVPDLLKGLFVNVSLSVKPEITAEGSARLTLGALSVNGVTLPWDALQGPLREYLRQATGEENIDPLSKVNEALQPFLKDAKRFEVVGDRLIVER